MQIKISILALAGLLSYSSALAQDQLPHEIDPLYVVVKDAAGEKIEGYLRIYPGNLKVSTKDNQERSIPLKAIESIKPK